MPGLQLTRIEGAFLVYLARRIDREVALWQRHEQSKSACHAHIERLIDGALEILRRPDEVQAWLEAATLAPRLRDAPGREAR